MFGGLPGPILLASLPASYLTSQHPFPFHTRSLKPHPRSFLNSTIALKTSSIVVAPYPQPILGGLIRISDSRAVEIRAPSWQVYRAFKAPEQPVVHGLSVPHLFLMSQPISCPLEQDRILGPTSPGITSPTYTTSAQRPGSSLCLLVCPHSSPTWPLFPCIQSAGVGACLQRDARSPGGPLQAVTCRLLIISLSHGA